MSEAKDNENYDIDFAWGIKRGRGGQKKEVQFYESFTYDGVEYFLHDSVYLFKEGEAIPYIGKLIKIYEHTNTKARKVKVLWFFYPWEISNYLKGEHVLENELFLATGDGKGLANINPLEAIAGKCNVVCISKDERNRQPSTEELKMAHNVFYRTFDVQNHIVSDTLGEKIAMTKVNLLLNKNEFQPLDLRVVDSGNTVVGLEEPLASHKYILGADGTMERDAGIGSLFLKDKQKAKSSLDKSKFHLVRNIDVDEPDNSDLVAGREKRHKDPKGVDEDKHYDGSVGSLLVKDDKVSKGDGNADVPDDLGLVGLPATEVALASSGQKRSRSRSPDSKKNDVNEKSVVPPATTADNKKSKLVKDNKAIGAVAKVKTDHSDDKPFKKIKIDGADLLSSDNGGTNTPKSATVVSNKGSHSVDVGIDSNNRGRLIKGSNGISNGLSKKLKSEDKSDNKLLEASAKQSKDKQASAAVYISANKPSQSSNGDAETDDKGKLIRKIAVTSSGLSKKLKSSNSMVEDKSDDNLRKALIKEPKDMEAYGRVKEVTQRPPDRSKWFTASPWEERMKDARDQGRLILLQNLDPTFTSSEVENIIWHGFGESCNAKVVQHTATSSRRFGQAFVIFKTRELAEKIIKRLETECLMLQNGRPLVGSRYAACFPGKHSQFPGHLIIDKLRHQMQRESRDAVSTSHSAQPNTLEYEMALEWRLLQDRSELSWKMLYKKQQEQIKKIMASEKSK